ncbi:MAG TPA: cbb3-type cytochrome c oxidase N-terminal domain-containing protein [Archangium sp.]|uniref:cbb3-type cytochrome c oxidase N-terminal domain-containing protein n=1 Tax=Archangium sp. TaxID=1872627 RepID=UPI002E2F4007|nr:cbb3-type cytochrome c oxidase N-terminal domain-containing protein [Archangium sp.]HEX5754215.1 cbb3-type cytochrome c oxidase N-terminal domain-containing protein [Archangium sp.]
MSANDKPGILHVYDGIEEMDNHLPNWWLFLLWSTVLFGFGYWFYYQVSGVGPGSMAVYKAEAAEAARNAASNQPVSDETLLALMLDSQSVEQGKAQFTQQCAACHGQKGEGLIGPNLTDKFWLHGGTPMAIHKTVSEGVVAKGMPAWERTLGAERVRSIAAYVLTLKNTNVPGKAPQGELAE